MKDLHSYCKLSLNLKYYFVLFWGVLLKNLLDIFVIILFSIPLFLLI